MYGKLFAQMYDGTLATKGPWQAMVTFQQMIILADRGGIVDMTREAIARRTTIPADIINVGITALEQTDNESRTPAEDGKRIVRLSAERDWGWQIVNYEHYRNIRSQEERREYMRLYQQKRRAACKLDVNNVSNVNQSSKQEAVSSKHKDNYKAQAPFLLPEWIPQTQWQAWIESRTKARKTPTAFAKRLAVSKLDQLREQGHHPAAVLAQSAFNGWSGLFPIKEPQS